MGVLLGWAGGHEGWMGLSSGQPLPHSAPQGGLGWTISEATCALRVAATPGGLALCSPRVARGGGACRSVAHSPLTLWWLHQQLSPPLLSPLVYPSLESDEDSPVFKSRSKKRKGSGDAPYSGTGSAGDRG